MAPPDLDRLRSQLGWLQSKHAARAETPHDAEFSAFSQAGEDGIIQHLLARIPVPVPSEVFVEFGVGDYSESNTRLLLTQADWRGLIIDAEDAHSAFLRDHGLDWRHHIDAVTAFVDRDNINELISGAGIEGDIGLLSVDLDGNDLWILEAIDVVSPRILIVEYNSSFGPTAEVTVQYDPGFVRSEKHPTWLYWGASLAALTRVAREKGLALVASNKAGINAFFVRRDLLGPDLKEVSVEEAYVHSLVRDSRGPDGELSLVSDHKERLALIREMPLWDLEAERETTVGERFGV